MTLDAWRKAGKHYTHRGHEIFYRDEHGSGRKTPLVCVHGFPTASWDWNLLWPDLLKTFSRVIAPDMIGFGFSAKPRSYPYSIFDQADLFEGLLKRLGVGRFHMLAHDYGDTVAQELIARHNERQEKTSPLPLAGEGGRAAPGEGLFIESCVLLNGGLFPEVHRARPIQKLMLTPLGPLLAQLSGEKQFGRSFSAVFGPKTQPSAAELKDFWALNAHNDGATLFHRILRYIPERMANRERWVGALQKTKARLRMINGPADPVSGAHMAQRYREVVPNADVVMLADHIGHYPQVEDAKGTLKAFLGFHQ
ncbi:MAG: alpha/beta hydrolase [Pseudomonadota bacterium]